MELIKRIGLVVGQENVSLKLSPWGLYNDMGDEERFETWSALLRNLKKEAPRVSYVTFVEPRMEELIDNEAFQDSWGKGRPIDLNWARNLLGETPIMSAGGWGGGEHLGRG